VGELAREIIALVGRPVEMAVDPTRLRPEKSEVQRLLSDNRLAKERLGWQPRVALPEGLQRTIAWVAEHLDRYRPDQYQV
jgi:dTDP-glucose 4,6-dehydratase